MQARSLILRIPVLMVCMISIIFIIKGCKSDVSDENRNYKDAEIEKNEAKYVGGRNCTTCHKREHDLWRGSDHDMAMMRATDSTVLGDFNDSRFTHFGVTSHFYRKDKGFFVTTEDDEGQLVEFEIKYTFGIRPLQQYLIKFKDGRMQVLPLCWDTRPKAQGGQRWFHIYPNERITPEDPLFWTRLNQNWNYMCAECHSTNLIKNYEAESNTYHTTYSDIDVSCEACHGPGSRHIAWAEIYQKSGKPADKGNMGLDIILKSAAAGGWVFDGQAVTAKRSSAAKDKNLVEMCARCHSRRTSVVADYRYDQPLLATHRPVLLEENLYFPDGQILDEVYVYDSFLQSKMYSQGVICTDCHEPHSMKVYALDNSLCFRCHLHDTYGVRNHHFHDPQKAGALCIDCHMPERTYMVVDPRRDHSIRIPRPDLSVKYGTPNACNKCHPDKTAEWAASFTRKWYGEDFETRQHFAGAFFDARKDDPRAGEELLRIIYDQEQPDIVRASALLELRRFPGPALSPAISAMAGSPSGLIRYAAAQVSENLELTERWAVIKHLLQDPLEMVRIEAASRLNTVPRERLMETDIKMLDAAIREYIDSQNFNGERPESHLNLGVFYLGQQNYEAAESEYKKAIELEPGTPFPFINLADLYRSQNRDDLGEAVLQMALDKIGDYAELYYALAMLRVRQGQIDEALSTMKKGYELDPQNAVISYTYAIALNSSGKSSAALRILEKAREHNPYNRPIMEALVTINNESGNRKQALRYAGELQEMYPEEPGYNRMLNQLQSADKSAN